MKTTISFSLDAEVWKRFQMAAALNQESEDSAIDTLLRSYISKSFSQVANTYDTGAKGTPSSSEDEFSAKAIQRIPKWAKRTSQINHKIIRAYLQLEKSGPVTYASLLARCSDQVHHEDVYVPTFAPNFAQMKFDGEKSHGKVFEVTPDGQIIVWSEVEETLRKYANNFLYHTTDIGYLNVNNQRNMGKTSAKGTDHLQYLYLMRCENCDHEYFANGTDIFLKKCPNCQGGANTGK